MKRTAFYLRVLALEEEGHTTSDAQGIAMIEDLDDETCLHVDTTATKGYCDECGQDVGESDAEVFAREAPR